MTKQDVKDFLLWAIDNNLMDIECESLDKISESYINAQSKTLFISYLPDSNWMDIVIEWLDYKKQKRQTYKSEKSIKAFCLELVRLSNGELDVAKNIINNSIARNYAGIFTIKNNQNGQSINTAEAEQAEFRRVAEMLRRTVSNNSRPS
jgi:hypothetical protein